MRLLLLHGADPNIVDDKGRTPLGEACRRRNLICIDVNAAFRFFSSSH